MYDMVLCLVVQKTPNREGDRGMKLEERTT